MTALRCAGCGVEGRVPTIVWDRRDQPELPALRPAFDFHDDGRAALLCALCRGSYPTRHRVRKRLAEEGRL